MKQGALLVNIPAKYALGPSFWQFALQPTDCTARAEMYHICKTWILFYVLRLREIEKD